MTTLAKPGTNRAPTARATQTAASADRISANASRSPRDTRSPLDVRQAITDRIMALLEQGEGVFRQRWTQAAARGLPRNGLTGAPYHGANVLVLWDAAIEGGYASNVWLTYKQAERLGAQVRKGEHAVLCAHFERRARQGGDERSSRVPAPGETAGREAVEEGSEGQPQGEARSSVLLCRPFWVFNVAQIDRLPSEVLDLCAVPPVASPGAVERALRLLGGCDATIRYGFERAMYLPGLDEIRLPWPRQFTSAENHCATALHELVHWSGHARRLNRTFGARFGDAAYAFEELVAELGSAFVMGHCGLVEATIEGHAAYLDAWLRVLRNDRTAIFTAARLAGEAFEFILAREMPGLEPVGKRSDVPPDARLEATP
jgi:antirestriction protein ArdC